MNAAPYVGRYKSAALGLRVTATGNALYLEVDDWPVARYLAPLGSDRFVVGDYGMEIAFRRDARGGVNGLVFGQDTLPRQ